jgi:hypothetical protein
MAITWTTGMVTGSGMKVPVLAQATATAAHVDAVMVATRQLSHTNGSNMDENDYEIVPGYGDGYDDGYVYGDGYDDGYDDGYEQAWF